MDELTPRQSEVLNWIRERIRLTRVPPTVREIAAAHRVCGNAIQCILAALIRKGFLMRISGRARALVVVERPEAGEDVGRGE